MNILFVHQNFPGQYKHIAPAMVERGHKVVAIGMYKNNIPKGVEFVHYRAKRSTTKGIHPWAIDYEAKIIRAEACSLACQELRNKGFEPDVICVHPGWGEALLLREVWPHAKQLHFIEFFYGPDGKDVGFDPEFPVPDFAGRCRLYIKNTNNVMNLYGMDKGMSPTQWQKSTVPERFLDQIEVCHDGVDTQALKPNPNAVLETRTLDGNTIKFSKQDKVVTFINRNFEPSRGYHIFMRCLPELMKQEPDAQFVMIGGDDVSYGARPKSGTWKQIYLDEVKDQIDMSRLHFLGKVNYPTYCNAMQITSAHVYLTYPFVLSWSMLEAMAMGAPVIGSATPPVEEVIQDSVNGWLVDFFDREALVNKVSEVLNSNTHSITEAGRKTVVKQYDLATKCLPKQIQMIENLVCKK